MQLLIVMDIHIIFVSHAALSLHYLKLHVLSFSEHNCTPSGKKTVNEVQVLRSHTSIAQWLQGLYTP